MKNIKEAFGANLRKTRKCRKLTIDALAERSSISSRLLSNIEAGDTFLSTETLCKVCVALDIEPRILFDFDWYDKLLYYDEGTYVRHHFKVEVSEKKQLAKIKSLPELSGYKINQTIPSKQFPSFLIDFAKLHNKTIYVDYFNNGQREDVFKITPSGGLGHLFKISGNNKIKSKEEDENYLVVTDTIKGFYGEKKKLEYLLTAITALNDRKSRDKLRIMLDAMDISE